jgi:hypothetical protein
VEYDVAKVTAAGAFDNGWFDTGLGYVPGGWGASCSGGVCKFAAGLLEPASAVSGDGRVARIDLTSIPAGAGTFQLKIKAVKLSDRDGFVIPATIADDTIDVTTCGSATVSGKITLQGRATPIDGGTITLIDPTNTFPTINASFDGNGNYSVGNIPVLPGGSTYTIRAMHILYLGNEKALTLNPGSSLTGQNTRLLGGDANNSGLVAPNYKPGVEILDIGCIAADFGIGPDLCGADPTSNTDINKDTVVNIQDLSLAGGNYKKDPFQPW